jgi:predicted transcriptional regulator of viral defense system
MTYNYIENYLNEILAKGRYDVTLAELRDRFDSSEKAIKQGIYRLKSKKKLAQIRRGFYAIVAPQYSDWGMIPFYMFIDDLMKYLNREYYIGLISAAAIHGAAHQQPMQFQVITKKPALSNMENSKWKIRFFVKSKWRDSDIVEKKTEAGYINVSSPSLTAFDLVHYSKSNIGMDSVITILEELVESIKPSELNKTAIGQKVPDIQRLGYLLEQLGNEKLASVLFKRIAREPLKGIPISLGDKKREGAFDNKWNVIINTELDFECYQDDT